MHRRVSRREFLQSSAAAGLVAAAVPQVHAGSPPAGQKKALIGTPSRELLEKVKAAGFQGLESRAWSTSPDEAAGRRREAEQLGMRIHSVMRGWANFNSADPSEVAKDIASVKTALRAAEGYGADSILLVPCRLRDQVSVPRPEEFDIEFDPGNGHFRRVVKGDNSMYAPYIRAQNDAIDASRIAVKKLIPVAEQTGVIIALENVWSNFWVKPEPFAHFIASFDSPWVQCYFDIGNHVKYAPPEEWIRALGKLIAKVHVKDFKIDRHAPRGGKFVNIREGDVHWPSVTKELHRVGYQGWMTIEGSGGLSMEEKSKRLDLILAGK